MYITFINLSGIILNSELIAKYASFLSVAEKKRLDRISNDETKRNFIFGRFLMKSQLSRVLSCSISDIIISKGLNSRPELGGKFANSNINFNISHSKDMVALVVNDDAVGIDVEFKKKRNFIEISKNFFTKKESEALNILQQKSFSEDLPNLFYSFWTIKESFVKSIGDSILNRKIIPEIIFNNTDKSIDVLSLSHKFYTYAINQDYIMSISTKSKLAKDFKIEEIFLDGFCNAPQKSTKI